MKIIKNFLDKKSHKEIKKLLFSNNFPWYYNDFVSNKRDNNDFFFSHILYANEKSNSNYFNFFIDPILKKIQFKKLIRAKINCYTKMEKNRISKFHIDQFSDHKVALYTVNTSNGYTLFKEGNKFYSLENSLLIFDGNKKHCSVTQTDKKLRINININLEQ